jgi:putative transposase
MVKKIREELPMLGTIKLLYMLENKLKAHHLSIGRDTLFSLLRENKLLIKPRKRFARTTNSNHTFFKWPDLVNRRAATMPEEIWVSDITYIRSKNGFYYLDLITDAYSRKIVGYYLSYNLKASGCLRAFKMAINTRLYPSRPLIHHSDQGIQYCCAAYVKTLQNKKIAISMTQDGSPYDNAIAERVNGILKHEFALFATFETFDQATKTVAEAIRKYNEIRPHFSCELQTPFYRHAAVNVHQKLYFDNTV